MKILIYMFSIKKFTWQLKHLVHKLIKHVGLGHSAWVTIYIIFFFVDVCDFLLMFCNNFHKFSSTFFFFYFFHIKTFTFFCCCDNENKLLPQLPSKLLLFVCMTAWLWSQPYYPSNPKNKTYFRYYFCLMLNTLTSFCFHMWSLTDKLRHVKVFFFDRLLITFTFMSLSFCFKLSSFESNQNLFANLLPHKVKKRKIKRK